MVTLGIAIVGLLTWGEDFWAEDDYEDEKRGKVRKDEVEEES